VLQVLAAMSDFFGFFGGKDQERAEAWTTVRRLIVNRNDLQKAYLPPMQRKLRDAKDFLRSIAHKHPEWIVRRIT
jgi:hypothetical protein